MPWLQAYDSLKNITLAHQTPPNPQGTQNEKSPNIYIYPNIKIFKFIQVL